MTHHASDLSAMRAALNGDPHRPIYHFCPPANWMNDPNGLIHWRGQVHLFYQYNPFAAVHRTIHWGHAVSADLVTWRDLPVALTPTPDSPDADSCWSGCITDVDGVPTLYYTSVFPQSQSIALPADPSDPDLTAWEKYPGNPVVSGIPDEAILGGEERPEVRDPVVWREDGVWLMTLGTGIAGVGGAVLLYRSHDGRAWEYVHVAHAGVMGAKATVWECPNLFALDGAHALIVSELPVGRSAHVQIGAWADLKFTPRTTGLVDHGPVFYAPQTWLHGDGRRMMIGWIKEQRPVELHRDAGWAGAMTVPRVLTVRGDRLCQTPAPELTALRGAALYQGDVALVPGEVYPIADSRHAEIVITAPADAIFALGVLSSGTGEEDEETLIDYDASYATLLVSTTDASLHPAIDGEAVTAPLHVEGETVTLRIYVDGSVIELFVDDTLAVTARAYPTRADASAIVLYGTDESVTVTCTVWQMKSAFV